MSDPNIGNSILIDPEKNQDNESDDDNEKNEHDSNTLSQSKNKKKKKKKNKSVESTIQTNSVNQSNTMSVMGKKIHERMLKAAEEEARIKALEEEAERKAKEEEERLLTEERKIQEEKNQKRKMKQDKIQAKKDAGTYMTKSEKDKAKKNKDILNNLMKYNGLTYLNGKIIQDSNTSASVSFDKEINQQNQAEDINLVKEDDITDDTSDDESEKINLRSIISCIMGHVDTGKTKLLDKIRGTNVQDGEAGGITQQIGATFIPKITLESKVVLDQYLKFEIKVPGLLMIDTPGHEAFANLRERGSNLCDIAIVVVDLVHGLEPQTIQSINMLRESNTRFVFAFNKIDRLYGWVTDPDNPYRDIQSCLQAQDSNTLSEFRTRLDQITVQIMELGLNVKLYWENDSIEDTYDIIPTSAITGEGLSDLLYVLINYSQNYLADNITESNESNDPDNFKCVIMESTITEGYGATVDSILINGKLSQGDRIIISTSNGPIQTTVRNILTTPPNRESRIKSEYIQHKSIKGAIGIKIVAPNINRALAGTPILLIYNSVSTEELMSLAQQSVNESNKIELDKQGVTIHASTLGSLEALIQFLRHECNPPIQISQANIGPVMKKDVVKTFISNEKLDKEFNSILAFNVEVDEDAQIEGNKCETRIFTAEIIYHLFDQFSQYKNQMFNIRKEAVRHKAIFPCVLKILSNCIFNKKNPLVFGVEVLEGNLRLNTPIIVPNTDVFIGKVISIENDHKSIQIAKKGMSVCIKVENEENSGINYGRHFTHEHNLFSKISRESIDIIKQYFKDDLNKDDIKLLSKMKKIFEIN